MNNLLRFNKIFKNNFNQIKNFSTITPTLDNVEIIKPKRKYTKKNKNYIIVPPTTNETSTTENNEITIIKPKRKYTRKIKDNNSNNNIDNSNNNNITTESPIINENNENNENKIKNIYIKKTLAIEEINKIKLKEEEKVNRIKKIKKDKQLKEYVEFNGFENFQQILSEIDDKKDKVIVSCSGGADSILLLELLKKWRTKEKREFAIHVVTFDHQIKEPVEAENIKEIERVIQRVIGKKRFINHEIIKISDSPVKPTESGLQEKLRNGRFAHFLELKKKMNNENGQMVVFLGTNLTDSIETFVQRISSKTGLFGLSGIPNYFEFGKNCRVFRPFLDISKDDIIQYCIQNDIEYYQDPTNFDLNYTRNSIRSNLSKYYNDSMSTSIDWIPFNQFLQSIDFIKTTTNHTINEIILQLLQRQFKHEIIDSKKNYNRNNRQTTSLTKTLPFIEIPCKQLESYPKAISTRLIHQLRLIFSKKFTQLQQTKLDNLMDKILTDPNAGTSLLDRKFKATTIQGLFIYKEPKLPCYTIQLSLLEFNRKLINLNFNKELNLCSYKFKLTKRFQRINNNNNNDNGNQENQEEQEEKSQFALRLFENDDSHLLSNTAKALVKSIKMYQRLLLFVLVDMETNQIVAIPALNYRTQAFDKKYNIEFHLDLDSNIRIDWSTK